MKKIKNIILTGISITIAFTSCEKYLEHAPDQRTELNTPEKVAELLVSAYSTSNYVPVCEVMSDNVVDNFGMGQPSALNEDSFFWRVIRGTSQDTPPHFWNGWYRAIAAANQALEASENASNPAVYNSHKGEALLARAYAHFMLVNLFAKTYDPVTSSSDLGVPYVTEPETVVWKNYTRGTVKSVYELIEKDIQEGLPLLNDGRYTVPKYHFTQRAAYAFATRYYLFKQEPDSVIKYANLAFPKDSFASYFRPWKTDFQSMTTTEMRTVFTQASQKHNLLLGQTISWWARNYAGNRYSISNALRTEIFNQTVAGHLDVFNKWTVNSGLSYFIRKYREHFVRTDLTVTTGQGYVMVPLFVTEEVLLSRAEAYAMRGDFQLALDDLNLYVSQRKLNTHNPLTLSDVTSFFNEADNKKALIEAILQMRRAEFLHEGLRWFDIRRHRLPITRTTHDGKEYVLSADDPRRELQMPEEVMLSGIELNPR